MTGIRLAVSWPDSEPLEFRQFEGDRVIQGLLRDLLNRTVRVSCERVMGALGVCVFGC